MAALQFADVPGYSAIVFRRTYQDLMLPEALIDRSIKWLAGSDAKWDGAQYVWTFPSGATLSFGYLKSEIDKFRYQSAEFQYIAFDELTQFPETQYRFLFSRLRRLEKVPIPLRMRSASNPGGIGHDWVKRRFLNPCKHHKDGFQVACIDCLQASRLSGRKFVPARLIDNPHLDQRAYIESLNQLDPITRRQYLNGDWTARHGGSKFQREWFQIVNQAPADAKRVRFWDMAATTPKQGSDPDYTVGIKLSEKDGVYYVEDVKRFRRSPQQVEQIILQTAQLDGLAVDIYMEQEPGSSGVMEIDHYARNILKGFTFRGDKTTGSKEVRANPVSSAAEAGNIKLMDGTWVNNFLDELEAFPLGEHDDQVDALSGAFGKLQRPKPWVARIEW